MVVGLGQFQPTGRVVHGVHPLVGGVGVQRSEDGEVVAHGRSRVPLLQKVVPQGHVVLFRQLAQQPVGFEPFGQVLNAVQRFLERTFARVVLPVETLKGLLDGDGFVLRDEAAMLGADAVDFVLGSLCPGLGFGKGVMGGASLDHLAFAVGEFDLHLKGRLQLLERVAGQFGWIGVAEACQVGQRLGFEAEFPFLLARQFDLPGGAVGDVGHRARLKRWRVVG